MSPDDLRDLNIAHLESKAVREGMLVRYEVDFSKPATALSKINILICVPGEPDIYYFVKVINRVPVIGGFPKIIFKMFPSEEAVRKSRLEQLLTDWNLCREWMAAVPFARCSWGSNPPVREEIEKIEHGSFTSLLGVVALMSTTGYLGEDERTGLISSPVSKHFRDIFNRRFRKFYNENYC